MPKPSERTALYSLIVLATTCVLPIVSIALDYSARPGPGLMFFVGKWFVFWGVGVRLFLAGVSQVLRPAFTASDILGAKDPGAEKIVVELGYANVALGLAGLLSLLWSDWVAPAGLAGGLFLGLAGLEHASNADRSAKENVAMATDFLVAAMVAAYLFSWATS